MVSKAEAEFRQMTISYGQLLSLDETTAISLISEELAGLARDLYGLTEVKASDIQIVIYAAMELCTSADDYMNAINDTIDGVSGQMDSNGFHY